VTSTDERQTGDEKTREAYLAAECDRRHPKHGGQVDRHPTTPKETAS